MLPLLGSGSFDTTQILDWSVSWYDSAMTVPETGIGFRLGVPLSTFTTAGMQAAADPAGFVSSGVSPTLSSWNTYGRTANIIDFWGSGAPPGISRARFVVYHYRGFLSSTTNRAWAHPQNTTASFWLSFAGNGYVRVQVNGVDVLSSRLDPNKFVSSTLISASVNDRIDVFYWQIGEAWGGLVGKYVVQNSGQSAASSSITATQYREAPVISASIIPFTTATEVVLPNVLNLQIETRSPIDIQTATFNVALKDLTTVSGWSLVENPRRLQYTSVNGTLLYTLKRRQLISADAGFSGEQYQRFYGYIEGIEESDGIVTIKCVSYIDKLVKLNLENYPDRISYASFGYFDQDSSANPIYNITAYDNWPLEHAIKDLCSRGGIDSKLFFGIKRTNNVNGTITDVQDEIGNKQYFLRAKTLSGGLLKLQKPVRYGNSGAGFSASKPNDDEYIYKPDVSKSILDFCKELSDSLGYDFRTNSLGYIVLTSRNNPARFTKISGGTQVVSPTALAGTYKEFTGGFNTSNTLNGARFDLVTGRRDTSGIVNYSVHIMSGVQVASGTINLALVGETAGVFYYDNRFTVDGTNSVVFSLYTGRWGQYEVRTSRNAGTIWLDSIVQYDYDSNISCLPEVLLTDKNIEQIRTEARTNESANHVVIIGKRKSTLTDSAKARNPNNPEEEFYVAAGADPSSIWDASAVNYVGGKVSILIVDNKVSDQDYANWAVQTLLTRQRDPGAAVDINIPAIPVVEPRDPITVSDQAHQSITSSTLQWIVSYREEYNIGSAKMQIATTAYEEIPSYEPRQDLSVDTIDTVYAGQPIINFTVQYPSIDSGTITNPVDNFVDARLWGYTGSGISNYLVTENRICNYASDSNGTYIIMSGASAWPPISDSIGLGEWRNSLNDANRFNLSQQYRYKNNPYQKFWHIYDYSTKKIHLPFQSGDQTGGYDRTYTGLDGYGVDDDVSIAYRGIDPTIVLTSIYSGTCPFFDPYMSELPDGKLIEISFDMLISGFYRVSVWDARDRNNPTLVAWLTEPGQEDNNQEKHWSYFTAGKSRKFLWDGVDTVGEWNQKQSSDYSWTARGWFATENRPVIGKGFYAWNDRTTQIVAISGQTLGGKLTFNPDNYSQFYVKIETTNDVFAAEAEVGNGESVRIVNSFNLANFPTQNAKKGIFIYTHLPPPNTIKISKIEDWNPLVKAYDNEADAYGITGWQVITSGTGDTASTIRNNKPIRVTLEALPRPGGRYSGNRQFTNTKVHRMAHLNSYIMDQFVTYLGEPWNTGGGTAEKKRITSRKLIGAEKTIDFADTDWRRGDSLDSLINTWVFRPQDFLVDVNGVKQALEYCNYLQLEELPDFSNNRGVGEKRSRIVLAYMAYMFYLSVYTQDRSGRMVWAIDPEFVDYSKIVRHSFKTTFPENLEEYSTRTIMARQWVDPAYINSLATQWHITSGTNAYNYIQFFHDRLESWDSDAAKGLRTDLNGGIVAGALTTGFTDKYSNFHVNTEKSLPSYYLVNRQLGDYTPSTITSFFGDWTWEGTSQQNPGSVASELLWIPDLTRDFHSFHLVPPMPFYTPRVADGGANTSTPWNYIYISTIREWLGLPFSDTAKFQLWQSAAWTPNQIFKANERIRFRPGHVIEEGLQANTRIEHNQFNYTRQDDLLHWEEYRGFFSTGPAPTRNSILVVPSAGPYLLNFFQYENIIRVGLLQNVTSDDDGDTAPFGAAVEYLARIKTGAAGNEGWFAATFRSKYNWYSSSFFPVDTFHRLDPKYLYPKHTIFNYGPAQAYDAGAWIGWKDDLLSTATKLEWEDRARSRTEDPQTLVPAGTTSYNIFDPRWLFNANIFGRKPIALGPKLPESKDIIVSLSLVNERRAIPIAGK